MCSDLDKFTFLTAMSSNSELHLVKENQEDIEFKILRRPSLDFTVLSESSDANGIIALQWHSQEEEEEEECKTTGDSSSRQLSLGELKATDDDDNDGFKTPTTMDHKMPVIKQCPAAPRKPRPALSTKRKAISPSNIRRRSLQLDLSREVESLFPRPILADFYQKMKKARREDTH